MKEIVKTFQELVDQSSHIVFSAARVFLRKAAFPISAV